MELQIRKCNTDNFDQAMRSMLDTVKNFVEAKLKDIDKENINFIEVLKEIHAFQEKTFHELEKSDKKFTQLFPLASLKIMVEDSEIQLDKVYDQYKRRISRVSRRDLEATIKAGLDKRIRHRVNLRYP